MDRHDDAELDRDEIDSTVDDRETHATTGGAAAAGAVTGGVIGLTGGPIGAAIGAVGGAIVGAAAERMMHSDDNEGRHPRAGFDNDRNPSIEDRTPIQRQPSDLPGNAAGERKSTSAVPREEDVTMERRPG